MTRAGSGLSANPDSAAAAREAIEEAMAEAKLDAASLVFLFTTPGHLQRWPEVVSAVAEGTGGARVVGCTGFGVLTAQGEIERTPGISVLAVGGDAPPAAPFLVEGLAEAPIECGRAIGRAARKELGDALSEESPPLVVIMPDSYQLQADALFEGIHEELGEDAIIVGGGAAEDGSAGRTFQFLDGQVQTGAVSGVVFANAPNRFIGISQAYLPVGEPRLITRAEDNVIWEISGERAYDAFAEAAGPEWMENIRVAAMNLFIGIPGDPDKVMLDHGEYIVRPIVGADEERGIIALPTPVKTGQAVTFAKRDGSRARDDLRTMLEKGARRFAAPEGGDARAFGLYFNCAGRGSSLYGKMEVDAMAIREKMRGLPVAGFFTGSEIAPIGKIDHLHQYSGVLVLVGEYTG